jgi:tRNA dimethylallyltransferase
LVAGGTGLYFEALIEGLSEIPQVPAKVRDEIENRRKKEGLPALVAELQKVDPLTADRLDLKNPRRVARALEVFQASGKPLSYWHAKKKKGIEADQVIWLGLDGARPWLNEKIHQRVDAMISAGWVEEARDLDKTHGREVILKTGALGYEEIYQLLDNEMPLPEARQKIEDQTRQYARRQMTWFKKMDFIQWKDPGKGMEDIKLFLEKTLGLSYNAS